MKKNIQKILRFLAQKILNKYHPEIVGITGSVGKTSAKEAIYVILKGRFKVRKSESNYNNEIGVLLTVLGCRSAGKSLLGWLKIFLTGIKLILFQDKDYPKILILEMAADRPGDIKYLTSIAPCKVGLVTAIGPVHLEFFKTVDNVAKEKRIMITHLKDNGWAILNYDDELVYLMKDKTRARVLTFGFNEGADVRASELNIKQGLETEELSERIKGISFKLNYKGNIVPVFLPKVLGKQQVYGVLAGTAVGLIFGMNLVEISEAFKEYKSLPGRMNLVAGIKRTLIIDDTYNASPVSVEAALDVVSGILVQGRKFAVLGDMLELGDFSRDGHGQAGRKVAESDIDYLITVGEKSRDIARVAIEHGFDEDNIFNFAFPEEAGIFVQNKIRQGDLILIKGSQNMRMEKIVKELMAEPLRANELLVRQSEDWIKR